MAFQHRVRVRCEPLNQPDHRVAGDRRGSRRGGAGHRHRPPSNSLSAVATLLSVASRWRVRLGGHQRPPSRDRTGTTGADSVPLPRSGGPPTKREKPARLRRSAPVLMSCTGPRPARKRCAPAEPLGSATIRPAMVATGILVPACKAHRASPRIGPPGSDGLVHSSKTTPDRVKSTARRCRRRNFRTRQVSRSVLSCEFAPRLARLRRKYADTGSINCSVQFCGFGGRLGVDWRCVADGGLGCCQVFSGQALSWVRAVPLFPSW